MDIRKTIYKILFFLLAAQVIPIIGAILQIPANNILGGYMMDLAVTGIILIIIGFIALLKYLGSKAFD